MRSALPPDSHRGIAGASRPSPQGLLLASFLVLVTALGCALHRQAAPRPAAAPSASAVAAPAVADVSLDPRPLTAAEASSYLGDAACARCHPNAYREHRRTRHSGTLRRVRVEGPLFANGNVVVDPRQGLRYHPVLAGGRGTIEVSDGRRSGRIAADYVLGTGRNAMTFLSGVGTEACYKLRLTYYTQPKKWDFTPSELPGDPISAPPGVLQTGRELDACLLCHATTLVRDVYGLRLRESRFGVGCERCHGPGKPHVEAVESTRTDPHIERLGRAVPARINELCGTCHHTSKSLTTDSARTERNLPRFQGLALERSACYRKSGTLSCVTCHNPHRDAAAGAAGYDTHCLSCHQPSPGQPQNKPCPINPRSGCTACHMPAQRIAGIPFTTYHTHWIRVWARTAGDGGKQRPE